MRLPQDRLQVVQGAVENQNLRPGQYGARQQDAHDMRWREDFPRSPDVRFQPLWQRIHSSSNSANRRAQRTSL